MIRRALQNTGWLMGARGINAVLSLFYLALATRALGLEGFGRFVLAVTFAQAITGLASFQTWQAVVRWGQREEMVEDAVGFAIALDLLSILAGAIAAAALLWLAGDWLPIPQELRVAAFGFTLASLLAIRSTPTGILRLHDRYAKGASADAVTPVVRVVGAGLAALLAPSVPAFLMAWGVAELATAATYWLYAMRVQPIRPHCISLVRLPRAAAGGWGFVWGTSLSGVLLIASRQILVLLVGAFGGAALAGIYRVAAQLGEGLLKLAQAILRATYPELVRNPAAAPQIALRIGRIALMTGIAATLLGALGGRWLIGLVAGPDYLAAYVPMILLSAAAAIELSGATLEALLVSRGHALRNVLLRAGPTLTALAALPFAIRAWGPTGPAAMVLGASLLTILGLVAANRKA
jgi:O-antigen/teichoic acid export membrane protein